VDTPNGPALAAESVDPAAEGAREDPAQRRLAVVFAAVLAAAAAPLLLMAGSLIPGIAPGTAWFRSSDTFPRIALAIVLVCAVLHARNVWRGATLSGDDIEDPAGKWRLVLSSMGVYVGYLLLAPLVGYATSTLAFGVVIGRLAGIGWRLSLLMAAGLTVALFLVFVIGLGVWFPSAPLARLL
jgi:hypothetical protein